MNPSAVDLIVILLGSVWVYFMSLICRVQLFVNKSDTSGYVLFCFTQACLWSFVFVQHLFSGIAGVDEQVWCSWICLIFFF